MKENPRTTVFPVSVGSPLRLTACAAVLAALGCVASAAALAAPSTPAGTTVSANWAGYVANSANAVSGAPTSFTDVAGSWVEPKANCGSTSSTGPTSSAFWVGLGGNAESSNALEQTGTEADCSAAGVAHYFAWYELVPAGSVRIGMAVKPGDELSASVSVNGTDVGVSMNDVTTGASFSKTLTMRSPDTSSAEWITEAPSLCMSAYSACRQQALTNFGKVAFTSATALGSGHSGAISDPSWTEAPVALQGYGGAGGSFGRFSAEHAVAEALPSGLSAHGTAFSVSWHKLALPQPPGGFGDGGFGGGGGGGGFGGGGGGFGGGGGGGGNGGGYSL